MKTSLYAIALAIGFTATPLLAQQQQTQQQELLQQQQQPQRFTNTPSLAQQQQPQQQDLFQQQPQQSAQAQQQVRDFFQRMETAITQAIRNGDFEQAAQHLQTNLAKGANFFVSNEVHIDNNLVASGVAEINQKNLSQLLGFAASMHTGQRLSNYDLSIRVQDVSLFPGGNIARVRTIFSEYAGLPSGQQGGGGQQQMAQTQQPGQVPGRGSLQQTAAELNAQSRCTHILFLTQSNVQIGDSFCRAQTHILTGGQM